MIFPIVYTRPLIKNIKFEHHFKKAFSIRLNIFMCDVLLFVNLRKSLPCVCLSLGGHNETQGLINTSYILPAYVPYVQAF